MKKTNFLVELRDKNTHIMAHARGDKIEEALIGAIRNLRMYNVDQSQNLAYVEELAEIRVVKEERIDLSRLKH